MSTNFSAGQQFSSFNALKTFLGSPGNNKEWHHIVEQCQEKSSRSGFSSKLINSVGNAISVSKDIHTKISAHYSSKQSFTNGKTVRDWLNKQPFQKQYEYGSKILRQFGVIK